MAEKELLLRERPSRFPQVKLMLDILYLRNHIAIIQTGDSRRGDGKDDSFQYCMTWWGPLLLKAKERLLGRGDKDGRELLRQLLDILPSATLTDSDYPQP
jgi:hypothetical protein